MTAVTIVAADVQWTGKKETGRSGEAVTRGMPAYKDNSDGNRLKKADADASASAAFAGFVLNDAADEQPVEYGYGDGLLTVGGTTVVVGQIYVVGLAGGDIVPYSDLGSGDFVTYLGVGETTSQIRCDPHASGVAKA